MHSVPAGNQPGPPPARAVAPRVPPPAAVPPPAVPLAVQDFRQVSPAVSSPAGAGGVAQVADCSALGWEELQYAVQNCCACQLAAGRKQVVFGEGSPQARLMFIGEGPGEEEDRQGRPFVGRAGQMLSNMIKAMGFERQVQDPARAVYIANIVKCRPPQNRNPEATEVQACLPFLQRQIALLRPQVIVLLGAVPLRCLLGLVGINKYRGSWLDYQGIPVLPTYHPAYLLRFEQQKSKFVEEKSKVWEDLQKVMARLKT
ncbi:MAG: uracil-DNA glycosylase [Oligosphaeraceae bacterium]|nr:uracil-DNA glycosylase [Oligosphaeraceae bacterium]